MYKTALLKFEKNGEIRVNYNGQWESCKFPPKAANKKDISIKGLTCLEKQSTWLIRLGIDKLEEIHDFDRKFLSDSYSLNYKNGGI